MSATMTGVKRTRNEVTIYKNIFQVIILLSAACSSVFSASVDFTTSDTLNNISVDKHIHDNLTETDGVAVKDTKEIINKQTGDTRDVVVRALVLEETSSKKNYMEDGVILVYEGNALTLLLYGDHVDRVRRAKLTTAQSEAGGSCTSQSGHYQVNSFIN